jgi:hypothetical protein
MYLTEEEARGTYCPEDKEACLGRQCPAWRWDMRYESAVEEGHGGDVVIRLKRLKGEPKRGYCGLGGKP